MIVVGEPWKLGTMEVKGKPRATTEAIEKKLDLKRRKRRSRHEFRGRDKTELYPDCIFTLRCQNISADGSSKTFYTQD